MPRVSGSSSATSCTIISDHRELKQFSQDFVSARGRIEQILPRCANRFKITLVELHRPNVLQNFDIVPIFGNVLKNLVVKFVEQVF